MPVYEIPFKINAYLILEVEAENEEDAINKAIKKASIDTIVETWEDKPTKITTHDGHLLLMNDDLMLESNSIYTIKNNQK